MKKIVCAFKYLTLIFAFFLFNNVAKAELRDSYTKRSNDGYSSMGSDFFIGFNGSPAEGGVYHHTVDTGEEIYCLDMGLVSAYNLSTLFDLDPENPDRPFDKGIIYIASADADYRSKVTALRAFTAMTRRYRNLYLGSGYSVDPQRAAGKYAQYVALVNSAVDWTYDTNRDVYSGNSFFRSAFGSTAENMYEGAAYSSPCAQSDNGCLRQDIVNHFFGMYGDSAFLYKDGNDRDRVVDGIFDKSPRLNESNPYVQEAKRLFQEAIRVSAAGNLNKDNKKITIQKPDKFSDNITGVPQVTPDGVTTTRELNFEMTLTNFHENKNGDVRLDINPDTENAAGLKVFKMYYKRKLDTDWKEFNNSFDFMTLVTKQVEVFDIKVIVKTTQRVGQSTTVNFKVTPSYQFEIMGKGKVLSQAGQDDKHKQRYVIIEKGGKKPIPQEFTINWGPDICQMNPNTSNSDEYNTYINKCCFSDGTGTTLQEKCKKNDQNACKKFEEYCSPCAGEVNIPSSCDEFAGGEVPQCTDGADATVTGPTNIKACVLGNNNYKLSRDHAANRYCNIYCKEDFKLGMPLGKWVESGKSFTMDVTVNGTKTCYTSEVLYQQYLNDLTNNETLIDEDKKEVDRLQGIVNVADSAGDVFGNPTLEAFTTSELGMALYNEHIEEICVKGDANTPQIQRCEGCGFTYCAKSGKVVSERNPEVTIDRIRQEAHSRLENAKNILNGDVRSYAEKQNDYKACSTLYNESSGTKDTLFKLRAEEQVQFEYSGNYTFNAGTNKANLKKQITKDYPAQVTLDSTWFCDSDVDDRYNECRGTASTQGVSENIKHPDCINNECNGNNWYENKAAHPVTTIVKTRYGKITSSYAALYVPSDLFVADISGMKKTRKEIEGLIAISTGDQSKLAERGYRKIVRKVYVNDEEISQEIFPIKLNADKGAYTYEVKFSGIGEYYNTGKTGRLIGDANSVVAQSNQSKFSGDYACAYTIDCPGCKVLPKSVPGTTIPGYRTEEPYQNITTYFDRTCKGCSVIWPATGENAGSPVIRQISLNKVNPTDRGLGYNLLNLKGVQAVKEIEQKGEEAYKTETYSITLTPNVINAINNYVKTNKSGSIPVNSVLDKCKNYSQSQYVTGKSRNATNKYDYLICESGLLDQLAQNKDAKVKDNLKYTSWIDSEYCSGNDCVIGAGFGYGNVFGPAYK